MQHDRQMGKDGVSRSLTLAGAFLGQWWLERESHVLPYLFIRVAGHRDNCLLMGDDVTMHLDISSAREGSCDESSTGLLHSFGELEVYEQKMAFAWCPFLTVLH